MTEYITCDTCFDNIEQLFYVEHHKGCLAEQQEHLIIQTKLKTTPDMVLTDMVLTECQKAAIKYSKTKSKIIQKNTRTLVLARFKYKGWTEDNLNCIIKYLQNHVKILTHANLSNNLIHYASSDTYKNQFEVLKTVPLDKSNPRFQWETTLYKRRKSQIWSIKSIERERWYKKLLWLW